MRLFNLTVLSIAMIATLGASAAMAAPNHHGKHRVCHVERQHHHNVRVCRWVR
jgi:hypothetical protein